VTITFIIKLTKTTKKHDSIILVVGKLTKDAQFISIKSTHKVANIAYIYMKEISKLHGIPKAIVLLSYLKFTFYFLKGLFKVFGTSLNLSTSYYP
jgi:hypothetical protein